MTELVSATLSDRVGPHDPPTPWRLRVLVVEDEMLLAMVVEDTLVDFGCEVVGPVARVADGVRIANSARLDGAILDINVAGASVFPVARELAQRNIPFVFVSGYGEDNLPQEWRGRPRLQKPVDPRDLVQRMESAFRKTRL
jgi:DNA-binding response OmpR family regulator